MRTMATRLKTKKKVLSKAKRRTSKETRASYVVERAVPLKRLDLATLEEAARAVNKTPHNIRDYIQRGRIAKYNPEGKRIIRASNGELRVSLLELRALLTLVAKGDEKHHHAGLHPELGFYNLAERERTKHVHRLHPYLGKFIPQLVEWFLSRYFNEDAVILDPFMGSGTTLVQGNELKMHTIGIDISEFNCRIARVKTARYELRKHDKKFWMPKAV